jgi:hypothetical protein
MHKTVTNQKRPFHIVGGGGTSSSSGISIPRYVFSVPYFNKITTQTAPRHYVRTGFFLRGSPAVIAASERSACRVIAGSERSEREPQSRRQRYLRK